MASAEQTRDHDKIRKWAKSRGGVPAVVEGTDSLLRIDFVEGARSGGHEDSLREVEWERWFSAFDDNELVFLYSPEKESRFFKLVSKESAGGSVR